MKRKMLAFLFFFSFVGTAYAQNSSAGLTPCGGGKSLSVTNSTANVQLSTCGQSAIIWNTGGVEAFLNIGTTNATAATTGTGYSLPPGSGFVLSTGAAPLYIAAITSTSTTTLRIIQGQGATSLASGFGFTGGGGSTQDVNLAQVAGVTTATGNGVVGTGVQRVAIASDNTAFSVNAVQSGTWTVTGAGGTFPITGATSNSSSGVATSSTNVPAVAYNYLYNGTTWDQRRTIAGAQTSGVGTAAVAIAPTSSSAGAITSVVSTSAESGHILKATPGNAYTASATNLNQTTAGFFVLLNATSVPADGAITPIACAPLPASGVASISYGSIPAAFSTGIVGVVTSATTCFTKTTGTITAYISGAVQ